jgi:hypothetical protein
MAVVGQQVHITGGSDHLIATKKAVVVDAERGIAVEVEKKVIAVDLGDGRVAVREQERVIGAVMDTPVSNSNYVCTFPNI